MPAPVVEVVGRAQLVATMKQAGAKLTDLNAANRAVAAIVAAAAAAAAPRRTGRLATAARPVGTRAVAAVRFALPYAAPIHFGWHAHHIEPNPFAFDAAEATESQWTDVYERAIDAILADVHGA